MSTAHAVPEVPADWRSRTTVDVPVAGLKVGLSRNSAYAAAARGELPTIVLGHRLVCPVAKLRRLLGELPEAGDAS